MLTQNYYQHSPVQSSYYYPTTQYSCQPIDMQRFETRFNNYRLLNSITPFAIKPSPLKSSPPPSAIIKQKQKNTTNGKNDKHEKPLQKNYQHEQNLRTTSVIMKVEAQKILKISTNDIKLNIDNLDEVEDEIICKWENCYKIVLTLDELASHVTQNHAVATIGGLYNCKWEACPRSDRGFNARYKMLVHVRTHTKEKPHQCIQCDKSFSRAENLKIHVRSHSGEKPYICPVFGCNKAYSNSSDRFKHTRTHSTEKPYICKVNGCNKKYTDPSSLRKHVKTFKHATKTLNMDTPTENCKANMNGFPIPHHQQSYLTQKSSSSPLLSSLSQQSSSPSSSEFNKYYANEINVLEITHPNEQYYAKVEEQQQPQQLTFVDTNTENLKCNCAIEYVHKTFYPDDTNDFLKFDQLSSKLDVINLHVNDGDGSEQNQKNVVQDNVKITNIIDIKIENRCTDSPLDLSIHKRYYHYQH